MTFPDCTEGCVSNLNRGVSFSFTGVFVSLWEDDFIIFIYFRISVAQMYLCIHMYTYVHIQRERDRKFYYMCVSFITNVKDWNTAFYMHAEHSAQCVGVRQCCSIHQGAGSTRAAAGLCAEFHWAQCKTVGAMPGGARWCTSGARCCSYPQGPPECKSTDVARGTY